MVNDVSGVYAPAKRMLFMELPSEDEETKSNKVGRLNVCTCGALDATKG